MSNLPCNLSGENLEAPASSSSSSLKRRLPQQPPSAHLDRPLKLFRVDSSGITVNTASAQIQTDGLELLANASTRSVCISLMSFDESSPVPIDQQLDNQFQIEPTPSSVSMNCICSLCSESFASSDSVNEHLAKDHHLIDLERTKQVCCLVCNTFQGNMQLHSVHLIQAHAMETQEMISKTSIVNAPVSQSTGASLSDLCQVKEFKSILGNTFLNDIGKVLICSSCCRSGMLDAKRAPTP